MKALTAPAPPGLRQGSPHPPPRPQTPICDKGLGAGRLHIHHRSLQEPATPLPLSALLSVQLLCEQAATEEITSAVFSFHFYLPTYRVVDSEQIQLLECQKMMGNPNFPHPPSAKNPKETKSNSKVLIIPEEKYFLKLSLLYRYSVPLSTFQLVTDREQSQLQGEEKLTVK